MKKANIPVSVANNLVIAIYYHPEGYPPTLNAIAELSDCFDQITVIHRPNIQGTWKYPSNVRAIPSGRFITAVNQENSSVIRKVSFFIQFLRLFYFNCFTKKPKVILVYDSLGLYAYHLIRPFLFFKHKVWYHNHDVTEHQALRKYSIGWFAARQEVKSFKYLDIFTLPTDERMRYFPMHTFTGRYFTIPNYPSIKFYSRFYENKKLQQPVRLIFQGSIGPYHGIEEIIPLLKETINGFNVELVLKGSCREEYKKHCLQMAEDHLVSDKLIFLGYTPYIEVPKASSECHIGIGILAKQDIMNTTLGTASNKLYEYAAVGLPVIYYNSENFTKYLGNCKWAVPVNLNSQSIKDAIKLITGSYDEMSDLAHNDFERKLNFESGFTEMKEFLITLKEY